MKVIALLVSMNFEVSQETNSNGLQVRFGPLAAI